MTMPAVPESKRISADDAAALVRPGHWVDYGGGLCRPDLFDQALARRKSELHEARKSVG
jgi:hypothetical protein